VGVVGVGVSAAVGVGAGAGVAGAGGGSPSRWMSRKDRERRVLAVQFCPEMTTWY
jgi:hypothetical protein